MSSYIPKHIQVEILRWLPVRALLRFRCVCISWKQHIDSQAFIHEHLAVQKPRLMVQCEEDELMILDPQILHSFNISSFDYIIGTLHGVVCLFDYKRTFHLWNPSTRKLLTLPEPEREYVFYDRDHVAYQDFSYTSFWIDPCNKDFKVVLFNLTISGYDLFYSSVKNEWKLSPDLSVVEDCCSLMGYRSVLIEGVAYWGALAFENMKYNVVIICFDFGKERFDLVKAPLITYHERYEPVLYECQGGLSLACLDSDKRCNLYSRKEDRWVNMFSFSLCPNVDKIWWVMGEKEGIQENTRVLNTIVRDEEVGEVAICDAKGGCATLKGGLHYDFDKVIFVTCNFVQSLVFPYRVISYDFSK